MTTPAIQLQDVTRRYGQLKAVDGVHLSVEEGSRHALIGPNGAGKSTLFALITGTINVSGGSISIAGTDVTRSPEHARARMGVGQTFQHSSVFGSLSVLRNVMLSASRKHGRPARMIPTRSNAVMEAAESCLVQVGLQDRACDMADLLSHGERRQLEVAIALALEPQIVLFDEPTAGMSANETERFVELVESLPTTLTLLMIEHDLDVVFSLADQVTVLHLGKVLAQGTPQEVRSSQIVQETYIGADPPDAGAGGEDVRTRGSTR